MKKILAFYLLISLSISANWSLIHTEDQIDIYTQSNKKGVMPFKAVGYISSNINNIVEVLKDYKNKHLWSPKLKRVELHEALNDNEYVFSEFYKTPWPATDREFLLKGSVVYLNKNKVIFSASSIDDPELFNDEYIQAEVKTLEITLEKSNEQQTKITFTFLGDMKGWMPTWLMNLIQKKMAITFYTIFERTSSYSL